MCEDKSVAILLCTSVFGVFIRGKISVILSNGIAITVIFYQLHLRCLTIVKNINSVQNNHKLRFTVPIKYNVIIAFHHNFRLMV